MSCSASARRAAGGRKKAAILSDVCESLIGAGLLDGGFEAARDLIVRSWGERSPPTPSPRATPRPRCRNGRRRARSPAPRYEEAARSGPAHAPLFVMRVELAGYEPETGEASSKRAAEQAAAQAFLDRWSGP